eukprot:TRINITY_DN27147_c0_g1_i3.p1 TRINITY_DN27147_c0_g1~~TRINITY_DN27147_c0_g1_i3.p1  ORF type:complete len:425 (-),score=86.74 TRINITY_DN27147_c0_g1_i3:285-1439(-)
MTAQAKAKSLPSRASTRRRTTVARAGALILEASQAQQGPPEWVEHTSAALIHRDDDLREAAAIRIQKHPEEATRWAAFFAGALVMNMLNDGSADIRRESIKALGCLGGVAKTHIDDVLTALGDDEDPSVRAAAAVFVGSLGKEGAAHADLLRQRAMEDPDEECRRMTAKALGKLGELGLGQLEFIANILTEDPEPIQRLRAAHALEALGKAAASQKHALEQAALKDEAYAIRQFASRALANVGETAGESAWTFTKELEESKSPSCRKNAAQALGVFLPLMNDGKAGKKQADDMFVIMLNKNDKKPLGIEIDQSDGKTLLIIHVKKGGLVEQWNEAHPDRAVLPGCRIIQVNEFEQNSKDMAEGISGISRRRSWQVICRATRRRS